MKRLIKKSELQLNIDDNVQWKKHPYDNSVYTVTDLLPDGTVFMDNGNNAYTNIKPSRLKLIN